MADPQDQATPVDIVKTVEQIRRQVRRRGQEGMGPNPCRVEDDDAAELGHSMEELQATQGVSAHWPIPWRTPLQAIFAFVQRLTRRFLRWYINPIVEQQNAFNAAAERTLGLLVRANTRLQGEVAALRRHLHLAEEGSTEGASPQEGRTDG